jgi:nitroreductase
MEMLKIIKERRSIRKFKEEPVPDNIIYEILEAGRWSPSGRNNQPWRFVVIKNRDIKDKLASLTKYTKIVNNSDFCIAMFFHTPSGYDRDKDLMSIGACIQNMLLQAHSAGIGSVWLGEILKNKEKINSILEIGEENENMALIAFGYPDEDGESERRSMNDILLKII